MVCHTPMLLGALTSSWPAEKRVDDEKNKKKTRKNTDRWHISAAILARRRQPVASSSPGPPPSVDVLGYVLAHRQGEQNDLQVWYFFFVFFWHSTPLSVRGNMKGILARSRRLVASREALNTLYRAISPVSRWRISSSVETCRAVVHSFVVDDRAIDLNTANWHSNT